jgi:hypothetical protein
MEVNSQTKRKCIQGHLGLSIKGITEGHAWEWGEKHSQDKHTYISPLWPLPLSPVLSKLCHESSWRISLHIVNVMLVYMGTILYHSIIFNLYVIPHCFYKYALSTYYVLDIDLEAG